MLGCISYALAQPLGLQVGRYSTVTTQPTAAQVNPLAAIAWFQFPVTVRTVGDALRHVLMMTGYQVISPAQQSLAVQQALHQPLPILRRVDLLGNPILTVLSKRLKA